MATTSTVAAFKAQIVDTLTTALSSVSLSSGPIPVTYAWSGADTQPEAVFLGPHPKAADIRLDLSSEIPTLKAGRKQRQENYTVRITVWTFRPDLEPQDAEECETRAFTILGHIEDEFADDPTLGLASIQVAHIESIASTLLPFQSGWACELGIDVDVRARLT